jgi:hypothetical protein
MGRSHVQPCALQVGTFPGECSKEAVRNVCTESENGFCSRRNLCLSTLSCWHAPRGATTTQAVSPCEFCRMCRDGPAFTIAARPSRSVAISEQSQQPGPGDYMVEIPEKGRAFSFVKATRQTLRVGTDAPGPGKYEVPGQPCGPAWSMPTASRAITDNQEGSDLPAPGDYEAPVRLQTWQNCALLAKQHTETSATCIKHRVHASTKVHSAASFLRMSQQAAIIHIGSPQQTFQ